jgi:hypothetical protein
MKFSGFFVAATILIAPSAVIADALVSSIENGDECPVTLGTDKLLVPNSRNEYGSEALAVALPADGTWGVTGPNARIAVKLFWRSAGFRPGMEQFLNVEIVNLHGGLNDAVVKDTTNANSAREDYEKAQYDDEWQDGWLMLTGIDFPSPGCWKITGEYLGQSLSFVVRTIDYSDARSDSE